MISTMIKSRIGTTERNQRERNLFSFDVEPFSGIDSRL
jgi:hypothetical protein